MAIDGKPERPLPGSTTVREIRVRVCRSCGYALGETGLCADDCDSDGDHDRSTYFVAVYERTDKFLRDEPAKEIS